ncbi:MULTISPECIES: SDR family oxidoreductase [unclassified Amycolatopsis]|uniref:SDR family oxidoreductase n=1 Tax=unclassified Amycolatopsis TaxID=2618356 RepID=UPI001C696285|nr:SDR family oxidoreductase [Amycolatopsis sp. DSM 110486]QYN20400.1 SDR family oxidoreductase [Amycolatopsis sp. DSM 110486]
MRIFVTGASGWIGSSVVPELIHAGHEVIGLARSDTATATIEQLGAEARRGGLDNLNTLRDAAEESDGVIHLAYAHELGQIGGAPADAAAIDTFTSALEGTDKPLLVTGATITVPGRAATEHDELVPEGPIAARIKNMQAALAAADRGVRVSLVMIPRSAHGKGEQHGFIPQLAARARTTGVSAYVGDGTNRWPAVHVKDAAALYRLAIEKAPAGSVLHAVGDEGVAFRDIAEAIARGVGVPAQSRPAEEFGMPLGALLGTDMPASSTITQQLLGWTPIHPGLIDDIEEGHYFA